MGNCHAAEIAAAVVEYPGGRVERVMELQVPAQRLMADYPGYFVALVSSSIVHPPRPSAIAAATAAPPSSNQLMNPRSIPSTPFSFKLLAADAPLRSGHRYRLLSFEEVLTCFSQGGVTAANLGRSPPPAMNTTKQHHVRSEGRGNHVYFNNHGVKIGC